MATPITYGEFNPAVELNQWAAAYWYFDVDEAVAELDHWIPPSGGVMLTILPDSTAILSGPRTEPFQRIIQGGTHVWGVIFWPGAATELLHLDIQDLVSQSLPAASVLTRDDNDRLCRSIASIDHVANLDELPARKRAMDSFLLSMVPAAGILDHHVMQVVFRMIGSQGETTVQEAIADLPISSRQFRRRFQKLVGLRPKELLRIQRLRSCAKESLGNPNRSWVELAAQLGYSDQAHLTREFRNLLGVTPSQFDKHFRDIDHRDLLR